MEKQNGDFGWMLRSSSVKRSVPLLLQCIGTNLDQDIYQQMLFKEVIFVFMSTIQDKFVGKMFENVLYHSGIVILPFVVPYGQICAGFDLSFLIFFFTLSS